MKIIKRKRSRHFSFSKKSNNSSKTLKSKEERDSIDQRSNTFSVGSTPPNSNSSNGKNFQYIEGRRYNNDVDMKVFFYGDKTTDKEKETTKGIVKANCINLYWNVSKISFVKNIKEMEGHILWKYL